MVRVSASQFHREFGRLRNIAQREAVVITSHGRDDIVLLSADKFLRLNRPALPQPSQLTYEQIAAAVAGSRRLQQGISQLSVQAVQQGDEPDRRG